MLSRIRLLVFDLDYLIYDCAAMRSRALRDALIEVADDLPHDVRIPDAVDAEEAFLSVGYRWMDSLPLGFGESPLEVFRDACRAHELRLAANGAGRVYPGFLNTLSFCRANQITPTIGAEATRDYLMAVSDRHEFDSLFEMAYCTEEYGAGGSDEMIEDIMSRAEVNPSETLVLGTRSDFFAAARSLDVFSIGCGWGLHQNGSLAESDLQASSLEELPGAIAEADEIAARK